MIIEINSQVIEDIISCLREFYLLRDHDIFEQSKCYVFKPTDPAEGVKEICKFPVRILPVYGNNGILAFHGIGKCGCGGSSAGWSHWSRGVGRRDSIGRGCRLRRKCAPCACFWQ